MASGLLAHTIAAVREEFDHNCKLDLPLTPNNTTGLGKPQEILKTFPKAGALACRQTLVSHRPLK